MDGQVLISLTNTEWAKLPEPGSTESHRRLESEAIIDEALKYELEKERKLGLHLMIDPDQSETNQDLLEFDWYIVS